MKNYFLSVFMIFAFAKAVTAQDAKADKLLNEVAEKFKSYDNVSFDYKLNIKNPKTGTDRDMQGDAKMSGEKYNVNFEGTNLIFDGKKQYAIDKANEQVDISKVSKDDDQAITPSNILTFYEKGYIKTWDILQNEGGRKIQFVKLTPIKSDSEYKNVLLGIDVNTKHIYKAIITDTSGNVVTFFMKSLKTNEPLPKNSFTYDPSKYKNWTIQEMN
ncbi:outer membrane lipoprotein-sorting protein [Nonlabens dokdonensis]|jgi:outer membrane lipoprotein-sorting protein|uniref:Gliding motility-related protein n=2 Tax=Nonlabens dokdonensis TaxID=328515 RepID=L7WFB4_NONDD|nr:outer membrane lipoprotein carrier protein LolA [Nonlabens dokdonensis]AGC78646.1 gliding motility-related protein [Nonlabens dokdonensis DSW-6]PZX39227.1 outer membrane lipoprotein-sorting protein [Nonlabens dokdonensis]